MHSITCYGEALIDFICEQTGNLSSGDTFVKKAGGAPANVAVGISKLGGIVGFVGMVGSDPFGTHLKKTLSDYGVNTDNFIQHPTARTSLAFVSRQKDGERDFVFFREPGADNLLKYEDLNHNLIKNTSIFHFGSISLIEDPLRTTTIKCLEAAKQSNTFISYDPNLRLNLWKDAESAKKGIMEVMHYANLLKVSDEELVFLTGHDNEQGLKVLHDAGPDVIFLSLGSKGSMVSVKGKLSICKPIQGIKAIDTTGAGDGFMAAILYQVGNLNDLPDDILNLQTMTDIGTFANKVGGVVTTKLGAMTALPTLEEIEKV
jgi:fructokinase